MFPCLSVAPLLFFLLLAIPYAYVRVLPTLGASVVFWAVFSANYLASHCEDWVRNAFLKPQIQCGLRNFEVAKFYSRSCIFSLTFNKIP